MSYPSSEPPPSLVMELEEQRKEKLENKRAHWSYDCIKRATSDLHFNELNIVKKINHSSHLFCCNGFALSIPKLWCHLVVKLFFTKQAGKDLMEV